MNRAEVEVSPLGGVGEFGKNCLLLRAGGKAIIVDAGISFPDETLPGVDRVAPDFSALAGEDVAGIFLTHGHEDHMGALGLLLEEVSAPLFATPFTRALAERRLLESGVRGTFRPVTFGSPVVAGNFTVTFVPVSHSVPQSAALLIEGAGRTIFHTGDFKIDDDSPAGERTDLDQFARMAGGCDLLLIDSTNADRPGRCPSEREARDGVTRQIVSAPARIVLTTFSSHVARISGAIDVARGAGRHAVLLGRSMREIAEIAARFAYLQPPRGGPPDRESLKDVAPKRLLAICAGSQGEPFSALYRLALGTHHDLALSAGDRVVFSARAIPGRETHVARMADHLLRRGAAVVEDGGPDARVHVSGHACRQDLKMVIEAIRPRGIFPVHGQRKALVRCGEIAEEAGISRDRIFIGDNGDSLFVGDSVRLVPRAREAGAVFLDAAGGDEIEDESLRERRILGSEGVVIILVNVTSKGATGIEVVSRGLAADPAELSGAVIREVAAAISRGSREEQRDAAWVRSQVQLAVKRLCRRVWNTRPMIIPVVAEK